MAPIFADWGDVRFEFLLSSSASSASIGVICGRMNADDERSRRELAQNSGETSRRWLELAHACR